MKYKFFAVLFVFLTSCNHDPEAACELSVKNATRNEIAEICVDGGRGSVNFGVLVSEAEKGRREFPIQEGANIGVRWRVEGENFMRNATNLLDSPLQKSHLVVLTIGENGASATAR